MHFSRLDGGVLYEHSRRKLRYLLSCLCKYKSSQMDISCCKINQTAAAAAEPTEGKGEKLGLKRAALMHCRFQTEKKRASSKNPGTDCYCRGNYGGHASLRVLPFLPRSLLG